MTYRLTLTVPELPRSINASDNRNRFLKSADRGRWGYLLRAALGRSAKPEVPLGRFNITFTRYSERTCDYPNLVNGFKLIEDILQPPSKRNPGGLSIIADDAPANYASTWGGADYRQQKAKRGEGRVTIEVIEEVGDDEG